MRSGENQTYQLPPGACIYTVCHGHAIALLVKLLRFNSAFVICDRVYSEWKMIPVKKENAFRLLLKLYVERTSGTRCIQEHIFMTV